MFSLVPSGAAPKIDADDASDSTKPLEESLVSSHGAGVTEQRIPLRIRKRLRLHEATGCWIWTGGRTSSGYGSLSRLGQNTTAHRAVYEFLHGPIPDGLVIDHLCRNSLCCRPDHLEVVTNQENVRRGDAAWIDGERQRSKSHCLQGHPLSGGNLYTTRMASASAEPASANETGATPSSAEPRRRDGAPPAFRLRPEGLPRLRWHSGDRWPPSYVRSFSWPPIAGPLPFPCS